MRIVLFDELGWSEDVFEIFELIAKYESYKGQLMFIYEELPYTYDKVGLFEKALSNFIEEQCETLENNGAGNLIIIDTDEKTIEKSSFVLVTKEIETKEIKIERTVTIGEKEKK